MSVSDARHNKNIDRSRAENIDTRSSLTAPLVACDTLNTLTVNALAFAVYLRPSSLLQSEISSSE